MNQHRIKQLEIENSRLKTNLLDEKQEYKNSKAEIEKTKDLKSVVSYCKKEYAGSEFIEMIKKGIDSTYTSLVEENTNLKTCIFDIQNELSRIVEDKSNLILSLRSKLKLPIQKNINLKIFSLKIIDPNGFKFVLGTKVKEIHKTLSENLRRIADFFDALIDPSKIYEFLDRLKVDPRVKYKLSELKDFEDLYDIIIDLLSHKQDNKLNDNVKAEEDFDSAHDTIKHSVSTNDEIPDDEIITQDFKKTNNSNLNYQKLKVEIERKKWEELFQTQTSSTVFESDNSDEE